MKSLFLSAWKAFIRYEEIPGRGKTLVYLPGLSLPVVGTFLSVVAHPDMAGYRSLLVDYLGSGFSEHSQQFDFALGSHAQCVAAILDHEGLQGCTVVGHSMGGTVGIMLAILRPDLVSNLIVAEANLAPGGGEGSRHIASFSQAEYLREAHFKLLEEIRQGEAEGDGTMAYLHSGWHIADPVGIHKNALALVELVPTFQTQYFALSIPRTFIYGEQNFPGGQGEITPDTPDPKELERHGIRVAVVPDAGHGMMEDNLDGFVRVLKNAVEVSQ